ncbi:MAG TPA: chloride channel protein, partial [Spirochaetia bacterium]|nr:chloride channel protein [Spirochaetia bacterium]
YFFAREAKGHGVPEVMYAITEKKGVIRPRIVIAKALASALSIGSGGSVGREGPIVQIGSAWGSTFGQFLGVRENQLRTLVACGAAAGIAATFNAPIGGVLFASEIILGSFAMTNLGSIVVASVLAATIGRIYFGNSASFPIPSYRVTGILPLGAFIILGVLGGLFGVFYSRVLYAFEDFWDRLKKIPEWVKPAIGGVIIGAVGFFVPQVFGVGYPTAEQALLNNLGIWTMLMLLVLKLFVTSTTIASGGSGGVFAPGLFMGAMLGGIWGDIANSIFPGITVTNGAFAMVGMATVFAGSARAPITAIVMLFEMTGNYELILPLMLSTVVGTTIASVIERESIYTMKLKRRGVDIILKRSSDRLSSIFVREAMRPIILTATESMKIIDAVDLFEDNVERFAVLRSDEGRARGIISRSQLFAELKSNHGKERLGTVSPLKTGCVLTDSRLADASKIMSDLNVPFLLVLDEEGDPAGTIDTDAIVHLYGKK